jgi:8-oxo-dGTP diphosphatase
MEINHQKLVINVVAAVIKEGNEFFIAQRNREKDFGLKWEFPGGKVESGETFEDALKREIKEELRVSISIKSKIIEVPYSDHCLNILLHYYLCEKMGDIRLVEHEKGVWVSKSDLYRFEFAPGDCLILKHL